MISFLCDFFVVLSASSYESYLQVLVQLGTPRLLYAVPANIPHNCNFFETGGILNPNILHPKITKDSPKKCKIFSFYNK